MHERMRQVARAVIDLIEQRLAHAHGDPGGGERLAQLENVRAGLDASYDLSASEPGHDRLTHVAEVFDLDELAQRLVAVAFAPEVDDAIGVAFDLLCGTAGTGHPTLGVALELCGVSTGDADAARTIGDGGSLRRHHLLFLAGPGTRLRRRVQLADRLVAHLLGSDVVDPAVDSITVDTLAMATDDSRRIARGLAYGAPLVWARASAIAGGLSVGAAAFESVNVATLAVDVSHVPAATSVTDLLVLAAREAGIAGCGLVVTGLDDLPARPVAGTPGLVDAVSVLEQAAVPVVVVSSLRWRSGWSQHIPLLVEVAVPTAQRRAELWSRTTGHGSEDIAALAENRISPDDILPASRYARLLAASRAGEAVPAVLLEAARTVELSRESTAVMDLAPRPTLHLSDLIIGPATQADVERVVRWGHAHRDLGREHREIYGKAGKGTGLAVLFTGNPGTGKTLAAQVVADELGLELMQVSLSATVDKYIGETEKNLERIFDSAEARNVVLFFDEADALFGSRSEVKEAKDRYANQEVAYLLQRIEYFSGITILATNYRGNMDSAFVRRIQLIVSFPDPDADARRRLWTEHLRSTGALEGSDAVDVGLLADLGELTGGDIRNIALGAAYDAAGEQQPIGMRHVRAATVREFRKLGRREPPGLSG